MTTTQANDYGSLEEQLLSSLLEKLNPVEEGAKQQHDQRELKDWQRIPSWDDHTWDTFLLLGGRGSGKTFAGARNVLDHLRRFGNKARVGCGGITQGDARDVQAEGESGLITMAPDEFRYNRSLGEAFHKNGGYVKFLGSEEPGRWNGPQWSLLWWDELALALEESYHQSQFGLRLLEHPRTIITTTPKARKFVREIADHPRTVMRRRTTYDNDNLSAYALDKFTERYGGSTLGRQELLAEWVDDIEGAYWRREWIENGRLTAVPANVTLRRVIVSVDPAGSHKPDNCETGLCVAGVGTDGRYYVLDARGVRTTPESWAREAVSLYHRYKADRVVAEVNYGGDMVVSVLRGIEPSLPIKKLTATRGKMVRAEPISSLYEQGKVSHIGYFKDLEEQMCLFPVVEDILKDQLDSLVWALSELSGAVPVDRSRRRHLTIVGGSKPYLRP